MHRAVHLARKLEDKKSQLLVTTFTTNLSVTIKHYIQQLAPDVCDRIEVTNLHALARTLCSRSGWKGRIADDSEIDQIWDDVWLSMSDELPFPREELQQEYELVIDPNGIDSEESYLTTVRSGQAPHQPTPKASGVANISLFSTGAKEAQFTYVRRCNS